MNRVFENGGARVWVAPALDRESGHGLNRSWVWSWVFAAQGRAVDPRDGVVKRHHLQEAGVSRWLALGTAAESKPGVSKA